MFNKKIIHIFTVFIFILIFCNMSFAGKSGGIEVGEMPMPFSGKTFERIKALGEETTKRIIDFFSTNKVKTPDVDKKVNETLDTLEQKVKGGEIESFLKTAVTGAENAMATVAESDFVDTAINFIKNNYMGILGGGAVGAFIFKKRR